MNNNQTPVFSEEFFGMAGDVGLDTIAAYLAAHNSPAELVDLIAAFGHMRYLESKTSVSGKHFTQNDNESAIYELGQLSHLVPKLGGRFVSENSQSEARDPVQWVVRMDPTLIKFFAN